MDASGDLYGTTINGGNATGDGTVFEVVNATSLSAPVLTSTNATTFLQSVAGSFTVAASGFPTPSLSESGTLPSGVTFTDNGNGTGSLAGTPASGTAGTYSITFTATNSAGSTRTSLKNQLQALALGQGTYRKKKLWTTLGRTELEALVLDPWAHRRRQELLQMLDQVAPVIAELDRAIAEEAAQRSDARRLMEQPGVGPVTALMFVLTIGPAERFRNSKQVVSYLGLNPQESSSGGRQLLGAISKQGNSLARYLLTEAAQTAARYDEELRRNYRRLRFRRGSAVAKVAIAGKLAVRLLHASPQSRFVEIGSRVEDREYAARRANQFFACAPSQRGWQRHRRSRARAPAWRVSARTIAHTRLPPCPPAPAAAGWCKTPQPPPPCVRGGAR
jgi:uncharacterized repeat protein (TIGR03803 family)